MLHPRGSGPGWWWGVTVSGCNHEIQESAESAAEAAWWYVLRDCARSVIVADGKGLLGVPTSRQETIKDEGFRVGKDGNALEVLMIFHFCSLSSGISRWPCSAHMLCDGTSFFEIHSSGKISST